MTGKINGEWTKNLNKRNEPANVSYQNRKISFLLFPIFILVDHEGKELFYH